MITILRLGMAAFGGASMLTKLIAIGSIVIALGTGYGLWHHHVWSKGYVRALTDIAKQDKKAIAIAKQYRSAAADCDGRGLRWDQSTGKCEGR
jgi:hypothetical protein